MKKKDDIGHECKDNQEVPSSQESINQDPDSDDGQGLTPRQVSVLQALLEGLSYTEAAKKAGVARQTIYNYLTNEDFKEALMRGQREIQDAARRRLVASLEIATQQHHSLLKETDNPWTLIQGIKLVYQATGMLKPSLGALPLQHEEEGKLKISVSSQYEAARHIADGLAKGRLDPQAAKVLFELLPQLVEYSGRAELQRVEDDPIRKQVAEMSVEARENIRAVMSLMWENLKEKRKPQDVRFPRFRVIRDGKEEIVRVRVVGNQLPPRKELADLGMVTEDLDKIYRH